MGSKLVRKSVRITEDEARALADLAAEYDASESDLIEDWVRHGLRASRIRRAAVAYDRGEVDLREGAAMAGIPIGVFVDELADRHISLLRDPELMEAEIADLLVSFGSSEERSAGSAPFERSPSVEQGKQAH